MTRHSEWFLLSEKIRAVYGLNQDSAFKNAGKLLEALPDCLLPNIREWIKGETLSDIRVRGYSIPMVLVLWKSGDFLSAALAVAELERDYDRTVRQIWNMRR